MGRKLDLGELTEEEEKIILDVINRDYTIRKVETNRIGQLVRTVEHEELVQKEVVKEAAEGEVQIDSLCAKCGKKFMWLINPKLQCSGCDLYFCKNKIDCIVFDRLTEKCFCKACIKQRDLHALAGDWFYLKLKGKFRRHAGAKVSREFKKRRRGRTESESSLPPSKPPRLGFNEERSMSPASSIASTPASVRRNPSDRSYDSSIWQMSDRSYDTASIRSIESKNLATLETQTEETLTNSDSRDVSFQQKYDMEMDAVVIETSLEPPKTNEIEVQTNGMTHTIEIQTETDRQEDKLSEIKYELEAAISKILLPKLDELKQAQIEHQTELERQQKMEDAVKMAEELIDKALERAREKHSNMPHGPEENILLTKYLEESKPELMNKFASQLNEEGFYQPDGQVSARSSMRETGTMTETSDSEMESLSSHSDRRRTKDVPLSERLGSLSPDSLRSTLNQSQDSSRSSITQGVVLQKDQLVARADIDNTLEQILDEQGVKVHGTNSPQEFSTELKFTAVGGGKRRRFPSEESSDNSDDSDKELSSGVILTGSENWSTPELSKRPSQFGKTTNTNSSNSLMSFQNHVESPYDHLETVDSDSENRECVQEEQVLASLVRRPEGPMSPPALMSTQIEITDKLPEKKPHLPVNIAVDPLLIESMSEDLSRHTEKTKTEEVTLKSPQVVEQIIHAVDREAKEFQEPQLFECEDDIHEPAKLDVRYSFDSGIFSPGTPSSESELSAILENDDENRTGDNTSIDSESDSSDSDTSEPSENQKRSSKILQPKRLTVTTTDVSISPRQLSYDDDLIVDDDDFGDKMAEAIAAQQRKSYEPEQQDVIIDTSIHVEHHDDHESKSSDDESVKSGRDTQTPTQGHGVDKVVIDTSIHVKHHDHSDSESRDDESVKSGRNTPTSTLERSVGESAVGMRIVNDKSIEIMSDVIQNIEEVKGHTSSSDDDSESDKTVSLHGSVEDIHKMNEAEEKIYINAAKTYVMEEKLDQLEREATSLNQFDPDSEERLQQLEKEVEFAETNVEDVRTGVKSIDDIMKELRGAGLKAERGNFKRTSLDSATAMNKQDQKKPSRYSLPASSKSQRPVNASPERNTYVTGNTITIIPSKAAAAPSFQSTPRQRTLSASSTSSHSSSISNTRSISSVSSTPRSISSDTSHSRNHSDDAAELKPIQATISAPINASLPAQEINSSITTTSTHTSLPGMTRYSNSESAHSSTSSTPTHSRSSSIEKMEAKEPVMIAPKAASSISSNSASSIDSHSSSASHSSSISHSTSASDHSMVDENLQESGYIPAVGIVVGLSAQELDLADAPTPVPRQKKEVIEIEEAATVLAATQDTLEHKQSMEETLPAKDVHGMVDKFEKIASSSESGVEYTEPLIHQAMTSNSDSNGKKGKLFIKRKKNFIHQSYSTDSESDVRENKLKRKSKLHKDDSWMQRKENYSDSDTGSVASTSSWRSPDTTKSTRSTFANLTAAEQREMARIALMHLPETAIAEDHYRTKTINVVRKANTEQKKSQDEVLPAMEASPVQKNEDKNKSPQKNTLTITNADIHIIEKSPTASPRSARKLTLVDMEASKDSSTPSGERLKGTSFNTDKANLRHSFDSTPTPKVSSNGDARHTIHSMQNLELPSELDRSQVARGSITMRGGKAMLMTSSLDAKPEFQDIPE